MPRWNILPHDAFKNVTLYKTIWKISDMNKTLMISAAMAVVLAGAAIAQSPRNDPTAAASAVTGSMTPEDVGIAPMTGVSTSDFVNQAAAGDIFEMQAGEIAEHKSKVPAIKMFASTMVKDHATTTATLMAALNNAQRKIAKPSDQLPSDKQAMIDQLKSTPRGVAFDKLYLAQQLQAHQQAWALQKGYATDGDDASLRQVAAGAVPIVEGHLTMLKNLQAMQ
jgi:putative membrane protein